MQSAQTTPLISVVMPVFNARPHLVEAVRSIQAQTHPRWELLLVDDGSEDGSAVLCAELAAEDRRIRVLEVPHRGAADAVNAGVEVARGDLIARMDADDIALPHRFTVQLEWMRSKDVEVCGSCVLRFGDGRGPIWFPETHDAISREMLFRHGLLQPTVLMVAEAMRSNPYRGGARFEGNELWVRLRRSFRLGNVPAVLIKHRCHRRQTSALHRARLEEYVRASRRPLFQELFPDASGADADAVDRVADGAAFTSLGELEHAGEWLVRLADGPDAQLRRRMGERWRAACRAAAPLGPDVYRLHQQLAAELGPLRADLRLRAVCAARLPPHSRTADRLSRLSRPRRTGWGIGAG